MAFYLCSRRRPVWMALLFSEFLRMNGSRSLAFVSIHNFAQRVKHAAYPVDHLKCRLNSSLRDIDENHLLKAAELAKKGYGHTFPNPAVGCVIVDDRSGNVVGSGFHPRAGFPHAEVFALLEATGYVKSGVSAAEAVVASYEKPDPTLMDLFEKYSASDGAASLFGGYFSDTPVTAYVTLEPCCHYGRTPPCATTFVLAKISRVVVGFRDPNPRVDGGGVATLTNGGVEVIMALGTASQNVCQNLVTNFCKRITPRPEIQNNYEYINGKMRRFLRSYAARKQQSNELVSADWGGPSIAVDDSMEENILTMTLKPEWMEHVDSILWKHELVLLRLNKAVQKRKGTKGLGERIATALNAHIAQTKGHTILLYRPGIPPILKLDEIPLDD